MNAMTNSALVWKRKADESEQSARILTRISLVLLILMSLSGGYAYSTHTKMSDLCSSLQKQVSAAGSTTARQPMVEVLRGYCQ